LPILSMMRGRGNSCGLRPNAIVTLLIIWYNIFVKQKNKTTNESFSEEEKAVILRSIYKRTQHHIEDFGKQKDIAGAEEKLNIFTYT